MNSYAVRKRLVPFRVFFAIPLFGAACIAVAADDAGAAADRYAERDPVGFTAPRRPITRKDYVDFVRPLAAGFEAGPDRGQYGPRHALPALAVFALEGRLELGAGIKQTLRHYADWVDQCVRTQNRFVVVRDQTTFADRFRARVGPIWNTQNVGQPRGEHWLNTWFTAHWFQTARLYETPPWDLLVYYSPQPDRRLTVTELGEAHTGPTHLWSTQYAWEGDVQPGTRVQSVCVLLPHAPLRDASPLAQRIEVLRDEPGLAAVCVRGDHGCEVAVLNPEGAKLTLTPLAECPISTRARAAYVRIVDGQPAESVALDGSPLRIGGKLRALIVDGFSNHDWQQTTAIVRRILEETGRFEVSVSTSPPTKEAAGWDTWRPAFAAADVVILNCNSLGGRPTWPREIEAALEQYVRQGGGLYILHSANNAFAHWPEYNRMIGLGWRGKDDGYALTVSDDGRLTRIEPGEGSGTSHGPRVDAVIHVLGQHPIHAGYPRAWKTPQAEIYTYARGPAEELTVLSYAHDAQTGKNWPMEWVVQYGRGWVYNSTLGHVWAGDDDPVSTRCAGFRTTLIRAAEWLAGGRVTWPVPADFPTEDAVSSSVTGPKRPDVSSPR